MEEEQNPASPSHTSTEQIQQDAAKLPHQYGTTGEDAKSELRVATKSFLAATAIMKLPSLSNPKDRHEIVRHDIKQVICLVCNTEQEVAQVCNKCGVKMGEYFCDICKFYDDDTSKQHFHCDECGICRLGGRENFFHCEKCGLFDCKSAVISEIILLDTTTYDRLAICSGHKILVKYQIGNFFILSNDLKCPGSCYVIDMRDNHSCVENSMKNYCPICYEYLFDSVKQARVMKCGHTMHMDCFREMAKRQQYRCPLCSKTVMDTAYYWKMLDEEPSNDIEWLMDSIASSGNVKGNLNGQDKIDAAMQLIDLILALTIDFMIPYAHNFGIGITKLGWLPCTYIYSAITGDFSFDRLRLFKCPGTTSMSKFLDMPDFLSHFCEGFFYRFPSSAMTATVLAKSHFTLLGTNANSAARIIPEGLQGPVDK
ncbi:hypothetical protein SADUNF_Sadunf14G0100500 [Salix dunnii]|uniref:RING-type domain-containing protein n=1 Tax=Salix dunnii TaxID=1413687 RepID=A0A835JJ14_9ROSI|nr:hypothetical protein SADUNF_Sadunf14G0100500 [Salix dunnii]